jgi:hypothetical protein
VGKSDVQQIVDYTAMLAGHIDGVRGTFGAGQNFYEDPLRPGHMIVAAPSDPTAAFTHWTECPGAPAIKFLTQNGTVEISWQIPMRLWLPKGDLAETRRLSLPFYDKYIRMFVTDTSLGGLVNRSELTKFSQGGDDKWAWLDVYLTAVEVVNYFA